MLHQYLVQIFHRLFTSFCTDIKYNTLVITGFEIIAVVEIKIIKTEMLQMTARGLKKPPNSLQLDFHEG